MDDPQAIFFDFEKPCPDYIPNCEKLREEYKKELETYLSQGYCGGCVERSIKNKYTTFVLSSIQQ